jgi:hypothetical protein
LPLQVRDHFGDSAADQGGVFQGQWIANVFDATYFLAAFRRSVNGLPSVRPGQTE